jgi:hypothetical protein
MSDVVLDTKAFFKRVGKAFAAYDQPTAETEVLSSLVGLQVIMGEPNEDGLAYSKSSAIQVGRRISHYGTLQATNQPEPELER